LHAHRVTLNFHHIPLVMLVINLFCSFIHNACHNLYRSFINILFGHLILKNSSLKTFLVYNKWNVYFTWHICIRTCKQKITRKLLTHRHTNDKHIHFIDIYRLHLIYSNIHSSLLKFDKVYKKKLFLSRSVWIQMRHSVYIYILSPASVFILYFIHNQWFILLLFVHLLNIISSYFYLSKNCYLFQDLQ